jgi:hypothetical protein
MLSLPLSHTDSSPPHRYVGHVHWLGGLNNNLIFLLALSAVAMYMASMGIGGVAHEYSAARV